MGTNEGANLVSDLTETCQLQKSHIESLTTRAEKAEREQFKTITELNQFARICHEANKKWWIDKEGNPIERNKGELICLMHSELSEAMEGERKNLMDDKLPHRRMAEVELVDCLIRIFDYAAAFGYDLQGAFNDKMVFNATREDHKHEARDLANGKKW